ncbi:MAG: hypothetical protein Q9M18_06805, partial [Mariprofundaceae bacterium]|nr:hypothetical protein [Mariprofundaceae bacterium]
EVCFWYGWLGYIDACFALFIFASIATLWRAFEDKSARWLCLALILISIAFLIKNITAYALFFAAGLVLITRLKRWSLLKNPFFIILTCLAMSVPSLWQSFISSGADINLAGSSVDDIIRKFIGFDLFRVLNHWLTYPFIFIFRSLPLALFFIWLWLRHKQRFQWDEPLTTLALILLVCFLPFWISPGGGARYLIPLYGFVALLLTGLLLQLNQLQLKQSIRLIALLLMLKLPYSLLILPYIKDHMPERDIKAVAREVIAISHDAPLRTQSDVANGLSIAAYIDVWQQDKTPIHWYNGKEKGGYILAEEETDGFGELVKTWRLLGRLVYLYKQD